MKLIGLLGGTSWPSTPEYYRLLNMAAQSTLGGAHSAEILLYSINYDPIKSRYHGGWDEIPSLLEQKIKFLLKAAPDCLVLCNNTLHRAFDQIRGKLELSIPVFHAGHLAAQEAERQGRKTVLLLATAFTMEDGFFAKYFEDKGIRVVIPSAEDRTLIQTMQTDLAQSKDANPSYGGAFAAIMKRYPESEAAVLACTEIPLAVTEENSPLPLINTIECQCNAAAAFSFSFSPPIRQDLRKSVIALPLKC